MEGIFTAWGRILQGYRPYLSIEITSRCPLTCPGCYAYGEDHLGGEVTLTQLRDRQGQDLIDGVLDLVSHYRSLHVSIVGGEPLVRFRELNELLPLLAERGVHTQLVTSAVRPIPMEWASIENLSICVSIDGLPPEHDERRTPATYERILQNIEGHQITVHCVVTRQQVQRPGYLEEFVRVWSAEPTTRRIWFSLYTPQVGEESPECLLPGDRRQVVDELLRILPHYPKLAMTEGTVKAYADPPQSPDECILARTSDCVSADMESVITPCQFGGDPDCTQCGCLASAGLAALGRYKVANVLPVDTLFNASFRIGNGVRRLRGSSGNGYLRAPASS